MNLGKGAASSLGKSSNSIPSSIVRQTRGRKVIQPGFTDRRIQKTGPPPGPMFIGNTTEFVAETMLPTRHGIFRLRGYRYSVDNWKSFTEPVAIVSGKIEGQSEVPLRVHDACFTSEVLGSLKCDCAQQLEIALDYIQNNPPGLMIYLHQEGRGIGLANKIAAYALQESGLDTVDANRALGFPDDCREYSPVVNILENLGIKSVKLMTNNPRKIRVMEKLGVKIVERIPCRVPPGEYSQKYLEAKEKRMDHLLDGSWCFFDHDGEPIPPLSVMEFLKWGQKQIRQIALNLTETEVLVEEATNNEPWGPHGSAMARIAEEAQDPEKYKEIISVIARRLTDTPENWRHVYKALLLLEHLVRHGPTKVVRDIRANAALLQDLQSFDYKDKTGRDQGINVRNRSKELMALVNDEDRLNEARAKARANRDKYRGASKDEVRFMGVSSRHSQILPKRVVYEETEEEDPFEATRKRIEKIKAAESEPRTKPQMKVTVPQQQGREPKKLSQVKVNPAIAASIMKHGANPEVAPVAQHDPPKAETPVDDLLGDLDSDIAYSKAPEAAPESKSPVDMFDQIVTAAPSHQTQTQEEEWADFGSGQAEEPNMDFFEEVSGHQPTIPAEIPLSDLTGGNTVGQPQQSVMATPMFTQPVVVPQKKEDPFASLCVTNQKQSMVPMGIGRSQQGPPPVKEDMFTALTAAASMGVGPQMPMPQPAGFESNGMFVKKAQGAQTAVHQGGMPMNPAAAPRPVLQRKDPFANLGF